MKDRNFTELMMNAMGWEGSVVTDDDLILEYPVCVYTFADDTRLTAVCPDIPTEEVPENATLEETLNALFDMDQIEAQVETVIGFYADTAIDGEQLPDIADEAALNALLDALSDEDRMRGEVTAQDDFTACITQDGKMLAAAGAVRMGGLADVSLCVHPQARRRGLGKRVLLALLYKIRQAGLVPLYRVEQSNTPSVELATSAWLEAGFYMDGAQLFFPEEA